MSDDRNDVIRSKHRISELESDVAEMSGSIETLKTMVSQIISGVASLETRVRVLEKNHDTNEEEGRGQRNNVYKVLQCIT